MFCLLVHSRAEMRIVRCMCGAKLTDRLPCMELREKLELEDTVTVLHCKRLQIVVTCYRRMKKSMDYEVKN